MSLHMTAVIGQLAQSGRDRQLPQDLLRRQRARRLRAPGLPGLHLQMLNLSVTVILRGSWL